MGIMISQDAAWGLRFSRSQSNRLLALEWEDRLQPRSSWLQMICEIAIAAGVAVALIWVSP